MGKVRSLVLALIIVSLLAGGTVQAAQVLRVPTADVTAQGRLSLDYLYHRGLHTVRLDLGVYPGFSVGVRQDVQGALYAALKAALLEETQELPGVALGGDFSLQRQDLYIVFSKQLGTPVLRAHAAIGLGRYSGGMAGVTYMLNPVKTSNVPTTFVFLEYDGLGLVGGVTAQFSPELNARLGITSQQGVSVGVNYKMEF